MKNEPNYPALTGHSIRIYYSSGYVTLKNLASESRSLLCRRQLFVPDNDNLCHATVITARGRQ